MSEVLHRLTEHVVNILDVAGAGVLLVDGESVLHPVTSLNEPASRLEAVEERHQQGPSIDAFTGRSAVVVPRLAAHASWPAWKAEAEQWGVQAVLGIPLLVGEDGLGALNVYSSEERDWRDPEIRVAQIVADMAASYVANASELERYRRIDEQLREALESRVVIEQAKGVLAAEEGVTVQEAFEILRGHARRHSVSVRVIADAVVNLGLRPGPVKARRRQRSTRGVRSTLAHRPAPPDGGPQADP